MVDRWRWELRPWDCWRRGELVERGLHWVAIPGRRRAGTVQDVE